MNYELRITDYEYVLGVQVREQKKPKHRVTKSQSTQRGFAKNVIRVS